MNIKLRLNWSDLFRIILGGSVLVQDPYNNSIIRVERGIDTYVCKR
jgi:hypothetical protein